MRNVIFGLILYLAIASPSVADTYKDGFAAYSRGDYAKALSILRPLATTGNPYAQHSIGVMYEAGHGVPINYTEAMAWYYKAAEQKLMPAQNNIGTMYALGRGVPPDYKLAEKWYRLAAEHGSAQAQFNLGELYDTGRVGVSQNHDEATKWYRLAAKQGHAGAQNNLGWMYENGRGVQQDIAEAIKWYELASAQGQTNAQINLGGIYDRGHGVVQDLVKASIWYRRAAKLGDPKAQYNLGTMYAQGQQGVERDDIKAYMWLYLASRTNVIDHIKNRDAVGKVLTPLQVSAAIARAKTCEEAKFVTIQPLRSQRDRIASECTAQHFQHAVPLFS